MFFSKKLPGHLDIYKLQMARQLLCKYHVPYSYIWKMAGFKSKRQMERLWDRYIRSLRNYSR